MEPENMTGRAGERLQLSCEVAGRGRGDQGHCTWTKDGNEVEMGERVRQEGCNLVMEPLLVGDEGEYRCHSANSLVSQPAMVKVEAEPGRPYIVQAREGDVLEVKEGLPVVLDCSSQGARPAAELIWRYGKVATSGFDIQEDVSRMEDGRTWKTTSRFQFVPLEDQSVTCSAHSDAFPDPKDSRALHLKVVYRPRVEVEALPRQAREGQDVTFTCSAVASPGDVTYKWFINDNEIEGQTDSMLTLERGGREHNMAEVRCKVENSVGIGEAATTISVASQPKITSQPKSVVAREGEEVNLECRAEASPQPQYAWVRIGKREEVVGVSSVLSITAGKNTVGRYLCRVFVEGRAAVNSEEATVSLLTSPHVHLPEVVAGRIADIFLYGCVVEGVVQVEPLLVAVLLVLKVAVRAVPVVLLDRAGAVHGEPARPLPPESLLVHATSGQQDLMQRILLHVPASQGLVVREDHGVVLDVALVRPLVDPAGVLGHGGAEPPHVVAVHVELGPAAHHPLGELVPAPAAQHHARAVEADAVEQSSDSGILSHDGLVIRCERLWATDCALDTRVLEARDPVDRSLDVDPEHIVVKLVQTEGKVFVKLLDEYGVDLVTSDLQRVALKLEVDGGVVVPDIGHVLNAGDLLGDHVGVLHGHQGHGYAH